MEKLPSGQWRERVTVCTDGSGKRIRKSFTAPTQKEVKENIQKWKAEEAERKLDASDPTIKKAIDDYINSKTAVLSPSTIRGYRQCQRNYYDSVNDMRVSEVTSKDLQFFVSELVKREISPKTVKNIYGLLSSALRQCNPEKIYSVTMPTYIKPEPNTPIDSQVKALIDAADPETKLAIMLAAFGTLRKGEVVALKGKDVLWDFHAVYVHADIVMDEFNTWVYKEHPKTSGSVRRVILPKEVMEYIPETGPEDFIIPLTPNALGLRFYKLCKRVGFHVPFHSLRHYAASFMHALGIPDKYIQEQGGWASDNVLKSVYQNTLSDKRIEFTKRANDYISENFFQKNGTRTGHNA